MTSFDFLQTRPGTVVTNIKDWLEAESVEFVECLVPDLNGVAKGKTVPAHDLVTGNLRLPVGIFGQDVVGGWCEDHDLIDVADVDMLLVPDEKTLVKQPWSARNLAQCICDCRDLEGDPVGIAPRGLLSRMVALFHELDLEPIVAQEAEFFLVERNPDPAHPLLAAPGVSGRQHKTPRSFQMEAMAEFSPFLEKLYEYSKAQNVGAAGVVQEMGQGQLEINFHHGAALDKADEMFCFKRIARQAAMEQGFYATFLSKPITGAPGSAMHLHQSLVNRSSGRNVFLDENGDFSETFHAYLGGLQKYTPHVMAFLAPNVNSYRRFEGADSCPTNVQWGIDNRTTGFRIPKGSASATRIENRIPGSDTNPYLAIASSLACGYLGIREGLKPTDPIADSAWDLAYTLPRTLRESLDALAQCRPLMELMGERFVKLFIDIKLREANAFSRVVTEWEREHLLLTV